MAGRIDLSTPIWAGSSASKRRKSVTSIRTEPLTFHFLAQSATRFWREGLAQEHHWVPNSGWVTFPVRREEDFKPAICLMRLSYLRYALKTASDPRRYLDEYSKELQLSPQLESLLEPFVPLIIPR